NSEKQLTSRLPHDPKELHSLAGSMMSCAARSLTAGYRKAPPFLQPGSYLFNTAFPVEPLSRYSSSCTLRVIWSAGPVPAHASMTPFRKTSSKCALLVPYGKGIPSPTSHLCFAARLG